MVEDTSINTPSGMLAHDMAGNGLPGLGFDGSIRWELEADGFWHFHERQKKGTMLGTACWTAWRLISFQATTFRLGMATRMAPAIRLMVVRRVWIENARIEGPLKY
jgi:hypothetical protein